MSKKTNWGDLPLRIVSGIVLISATCFALFEGGRVFSLFVSAFIVLGGIEAYKMMADRSHACLNYIAYIALAVLALGVLISDPWVICAGLALCIFNRMSFAGLMAVLALGAWALVSLRNGINGFETALFVVALAITSDSCAYFSGRLIGGPKLCPVISPNKTVAGSVGAIIGSMIVASILFVAFTGGFSWRALVWGAVMSVATQAGDFAESALKRRMGVKDSGNLIPGHGGVLDRADGILIAAIVLFLLEWAGFPAPLSF